MPQRARRPEDAGPAMGFLRSTFICCQEVPHE
jgi:hypothetical protein